MWEKRVLATAAAIVLGACDVTGPVPKAEARLVPLGRVCTSTSPVSELPALARDSLPEFGRDLNYIWAEVARRVPGGWGGYFLLEGETTMYLVDTSLRDEANEALKAEGIPAASRVLKGRWDFAQLYDWYRYLALHIASEVPGITALDIDELHNWIEYGVRGEAVLDNLAVAATALGIPCNLLAASIQELNTVD